MAQNGIDLADILEKAKIDPLILKNGQKVTTVEMWWKQRRPEIVEDFDREIYGRIPKDTPKIVWEVTGTINEKNGNVPVITKQLIGHVDNSSYPDISVDIRLTLSTPTNALGPVPVMMEFGFGGGFGSGSPHSGPSCTHSGRCGCAQKNSSCGFVVHRAASGR